LDTLKNILAIIEKDSLLEFCAHAPLLLNGKQRFVFLDKLAEHVSNRAFDDIDVVIDGLFSTDAKHHWEVNQGVYQELYSKGALNELVILNAFPWGGIETFKELSENDIFKKSAETVQDDIARMTPFDPASSNTFAFIQSLSNYCTKPRSITDLHALGRLAQWYLRFNVKFALLDALEEETLCEALHTDELENVVELFDAYYSAHPEEYNLFINKNKAEIIGLLKKGSNTITIVENDDNIKIEYLIDADIDNINLNDESVKRARIIRSILPKYSIYNVNAIYALLPGLTYYTSVIDTSEKKLPNQNIDCNFKSHVNRIWIDTIMTNYESDSVYEWQKQWHDIRTKSLDLVMTCTRFIEARLGGKDNKVKRIATELDRILPDILHLFSTIKKFPQKVDFFVRPTRLEESFRSFSQWLFSWENFLRQLPSLFLGDDREKNLVNVNIQDARRKLIEF